MKREHQFKIIYRERGPGGKLGDMKTFKTTEKEEYIQFLRTATRERFRIEYTSVE